ncbi:MAG: Txe/YoeB family addiction module toxin [Bacteroidales bacterium]|nr:Txe/YoeB family addiction module toxin [Bacteroidales bacterium]
MKYKVDVLPQADRDIRNYLKAGNKAAFKKIQVLLKELEFHPTTGSGQPEQLKHNLSGYWSRRIDQKNRMVYRIEEEKVTVIVVSAAGHY